MTLELGGKAANIIFEDAALDQAVEGIVNGIFFNQGHVCCAGSRLLVQESVAELVLDKLQATAGDAARRRSARQEHRPRRDQQRRAAGADRGAVEAGVAEGAELYQPPCPLPERGYWFRPTVFTNVAQSHRIAQEEIFGPVLTRAHVPHAGRSGREGEQHAVRPSRGRVDREGIEDPLDGRPAARRRGVGEHVQPLRPGSPFGGFQECGFGREGGLHGLEPYLERDE